MSQPLDHYHNPTQEATMTTAVQPEPFPDEIVMAIAEGCLGPNFQAFTDSTGPTRSQRLLNFILTSRQFRRCGEATIYRQVDLMARPLEQSFQLLRTLLEVPELGKRTQVLKHWILYLNWVDNQLDIDSTGYPNLHPNPKWKGLLTPPIVEKIHALDLSEENKAEWIMKVNYSEPSYWLCALALLTPNVEHLEIASLERIRGLDFLARLARPSCGVLLPKLRSLKISTIDSSFRVVYRIHKLARLTQLKYLELTYEPNDLIEPFGHRRDGTPVPLEEGSSGVETLVLNGWIDALDLDLVFCQFGCTRSLTYRAIPRAYGPPHDWKYLARTDQQFMWSSLHSLKDTLEHLTLQFPLSDIDYFRLWPSNLARLNCLKSLTITGGFILTQSNEIPDIQELIPQNLEHLTLLMDRRALRQVWDLDQKAGLEPVLEHLQVFLKHPEANLARMKSVTLGPGLFSDDDFREMKSILLSEGIELRMRSAEPDKKMKEVDQQILKMKDDAFKAQRWDLSAEFAERRDAWLKSGRPW